MLKIIIIAVVAWILGVVGWSQIIGSIQNLSVKGSLLFTLILWVAIMTAGAYLAIAKLESIWPMIIGYAISLVQVLRQGRIE